MLTDSTPLDQAANKVIRNIEIIIPAGKNPERLDVFLARQVYELTRSQVRELMLAGNITVDDKVVKPSHKVRPGEVIRLQVLSRPPLEMTAEPIPLDIVWEDEWLVVINKPAGMVVHPAAGNRTGTLVNALLAHYEDLPVRDEPDRPGIVHRIDKNTSGLLVVCKRDPALSRMAELFRKHLIKREYLALAWWPLPQGNGVIDKPIGRDPRDRKKYTVRPEGKVALTRWKRLEQFDFICLLALRLETGRTHQIRVHLSDEGHPIFGDAEYKGRNRQMGKLSSSQRREAAFYLDKIKRQLLHAATLGFEHPITGEEILLKSKLPDDMQWMLDDLRKAGDKQML